MLSCGLVAQAQVPVFYESFDAEQSKQPTETGYYEKINMEEKDDWSLNSDGFSGKCFNFFNSDEVPNNDSWWRRAVKFRNLPLEQGKSYRLSFRFKGSNTYVDADSKEQKSRMKVGLMQGVENADISVLGAGDKDQYRFVSYFNPDDYEKYSLMYYFADKANQDAKYDESCSAKEEYNEANKNQYFATFNVFNPGDYYLDEVILEEANIAGMKYNEFVVCVDLGYPTNAASLAAEKGYYVLPNSSATVKVNGEEAKIETVELHSDGKLYVFLVDEIEDGAEVEVSFTNPEDSGFEYAADAAIQGAVLSFTEKAEFDENFNSGEITPWLYKEPVLVKTTPIDGSFCLDGNISEFTFTFDREVYSVANDAGDAPVAKLSDGTVLKLKEGTPETTNTLTFVREGADLEKGSYSLILENVVSGLGTEGADVFLSFEVGKIQLAETIYTDICQTLITGEPNGIPEGWTCMVKGTAGDWTSGEVWGGGSACRNFNTNGQMTFYLCDRDGFTYLMYGDQEDARLTLPAGNIVFSVMAVGHEAASRSLEYRIEDMDGNVVASKVGSTTVKAEDFTTIEAAGAITVEFNNPKEQNFILKIHEPEGGFVAARVIGFNAKSYVLTEGDKADSEMMMEEMFTTGGNMPSAESGWLCYENNAALTPGSGRNGTSGFLNRNFGPNMQNAFLSRECGANEDGAHRLTFADEESGHAPLELPAGSYDITFYCGTWNDDAGNAAGTSKTYFQLIDAVTGEPVVNHTHINKANFKNGGKADGSVEADKVVLSFVTEGGKYQIKTWGSTNTVVGAISIEKQGSKAAKYYTMLADAVELAKSELDASESANYDGDTKTKLAAAVALYSGDVDMHTAAEFEAVIEEFDKLKKAIKKRRANIDKYPQALAAVEKGLNDATGTKYEALEQFPIVEKAYNDYKDADYIAMDDETLQKAVTEMGDNGTLLSNMVATCVPLLTKQMTELAAAIVSLDEEMENHSYVIAVGKAITDDQTLVDNLKTIYAAKLYKKIADGFNFTEFDEDMMENVEVTIPASFLIQNANFYNTTVIPAGDANAPADVNDFPGWTIEVVKDKIQSLWSTVWGQKGATTVQPIADCAVTSPYGTGAYNVQQLVTKLPVAKYNASIEVASDKINDDELPYHIAFVDSEEKQWMGTTDENGNTTWSRDSKDPQVFENITPAIEGNYASLTIGAKLTNACFGKVDNASLTIVGKAEGFDYAAAAATLADEVAASIENAPAAPAGEPASVAYFDLSGRQVAKPQGVAIKVERWANGYTKVSKVVIK